MFRLREHGTESGDADRVAREHGVEGVELGAGDDVSAVNERKPPQRLASPRRRELSRVIALVGGWGQTLAPDFVGRVEDGAKDGPLGGSKICHREPRLYGSF
jgi:hypothetical protein